MFESGEAIASPLSHSETALKSGRCTNFQFSERVLGGGDCGGCGLAGDRRERAGRLGTGTGPEQAPHRRYCFSPAYEKCGPDGAGPAGRRDLIAVYRCDAGIPRVRFQLHRYAKLEPGYRKIWGGRSDLWHDHYLPHRHADRGAVRAYDRDVPDRTLSDFFAPSYRNCHRIAGGHSKHHLRNFGTVVFAPFLAIACAAAQLSQHSKMCLCFPCCLRVLLSASAF